MSTRRNPLGVHAAGSGGLAKSALPYAERVGAECLQVFVSNPRGWAPTTGDPAQDENFRQACASAALPVFVHAPYLINLGSPTPATVANSVAALRHNLRRAAAIGASGVVFHAGSAVDAGRHAEALADLGPRLVGVLDEAAALGIRLLVEPTAGGGRALAATVADLGPFLAAVDFHAGLGVCLDTCHLWAAGHDLARPGGTVDLLDEFVAVAGRDRLALIHANDSMDPCGSKRDRHANLGTGSIGVDGFAALFTHPATAGVPVIVETPDPAKDGAAHIADLAALTALRDKKLTGTRN
jgi:deoxyribonuclease-4